MQLHDMFYKFMSDYASELKDARLTGDYKRPWGELVRQTIKNVIQGKIANETYYVKGSVGAGRWTDVPWIAIFDKRITTSAQKGVYIVYLLNKDSKKLYLTFNQGATNVAQGENDSEPIKFTGIASSSNDATNTRLRLYAEEIRGKIGNFERLKCDPINTGSPAYDAGCIYYKRYTLESLPQDEELFADLSQFIRVYQRYYELYYAENTKVKGSVSTVEVGEVMLGVKDTLNEINKYIAGRGFYYSDALLKNFYLSLKAKPFLILAGTSGTGKTRLVRLFAEAIGAYGDGRYKQVAVKPDWSDSTDLFGHVNLENKFVPGIIVEFIKKAADDKRNLPYILCLDEMNLARVEYYFSEFLSIMETRDWDNEKVTSDRLIPRSCYSGDEKAESDYSNLTLPENLYVVGTVNMDETTFPFSKKVLDRANTIEFSNVDFNLPDALDNTESDVPIADNGFLRSSYLNLREDCVDYWESVKKYNDKIVEINEILKSKGANFGYRMRDEIVFYMLYNEQFDLLSENEAFDNQIMQKILPRIQGSSESIAEILRELFRFCAGSFANKNGQTDSFKMENYLKENSFIRYSRSAEKICSMLRRYEDDDFTSFWV